MIIQEEWLQKNGKYRCPFCDKEYSKRGVGTHVWRNHNNEGKNHGQRTGSAQIGRKAWNKGLTKNTDERVREQTERTLEKYKNGDIIAWSKDKKLSDYHKRAISKGMQRAVKENPESYSSKNICGRNKRYKLLFNNEEIVLHSSWELNVVTLLENSEIKWLRKIEEEIYYEWNGEKHRYFPDFYLPEYDKYIEVKGYIYNEEREELKRKSLDKRLILIDNESIDKIKKGDYSPVINKLQ